MIYQVSITKWRGLILLLAAGVLTAMLFFSGVLVGVGLWKPTKDELALLKEYKGRELAAAAAVKTTAPAAVSTQPAEHAVATPEAPEKSAPIVTTAGVAAPAPVQPDTAVHEASASESAADAALFVLQAGSFRDVKNAQQLQTELNGKGYQASVFNALDSDQRVWHVVRIGHYQDVASAAQDAARIGDKERLQLLIRRGGRL